MQRLLQLYIIILLPIFCFSQEEKISIDIDKISSLHLTREKFKSDDHLVNYENDFLISIDNTPLFGTDGELPKYYLKKALISINGKEIELDTKNMFNPWFGDFVDIDSFEIIHDGDNHHLIKGQFSQGAGSYAVEWLVEWNSSIRGIITKDENIILAYFKYKN